MFEFALAIIFGLVVGIICGLIPGLHTNTIGIFLLTLAFSLKLDALVASIFILTAAITQSFINFIPAIFLGAPEEDTALAISPGHKMLSEGRGYEALVLSILGGIVGLIFLIVLLPLLFKITPFLYQAIRPHLGWLLLIVAAYMIFLEKQKFKGIFVFLLAGIFGILVLNSHANSKFVVFPLLAGLFGLSSLLLSFMALPRIPVQNTNFNIDKILLAKNSFAGLLGGILAGLLPGIGSSQSAIMVQKLTRINERSGFLTAIASINIVDVFLSIAAIHLIGNPRSGTAIIIQQLLQTIGISHIILFISVGIIVAFAAAYATAFLGKRVSLFLHKIDYRKISIFVSLLLLAMSFVLTGVFGLAACVVGALIGTLPHIWNLKKSLLISCLLLNTMLFFFGILGNFVILLGL